MKKIKLSFYFIAAASLLPGFLLALFIALHPRPADIQLYRLVTGYRSNFLTWFASCLIEPKYWIPLYNGLLILFYYVFGSKFSKVIYGLVTIFILVYIIVTLSTYLGLADQGHLDRQSLTADEIARMEKWGLFSYRHIALVFSLATYLCIVFNHEYQWAKTGFVVCACLLLYCCVYSGNLLPFSAITAALIGNLTACLAAPLYVQRVVYPEVT